MRKLFIIDTYYQLILVIQMKTTLFRNDHFTVLISDHSKNTKMISNIIDEKKVFEECYFIKTMGNDEKNTKLKDCLSIGLLSSNRYGYILEEIEDCHFDEICCFYVGMEIEALYSILYSINSNIILSRFEEGMLSYDTGYYPSKKGNLISALRKMRRRKSVEEAMTNFYCYYPSLYKGTLMPIGVPLIHMNSETADIIREVFQPDLSKYSQRYIFFTSVYDFEGGKPVGEYELVCKLRNLVGNDNLLVKTHPRDTRTIYQDNGFNVDKNSSIPWEAIQLSGDFSDKVFMTINSGSVLSGSTMSENPVRTYYMYKLCDISGNSSCLNNARDIECLLDNKEMREILKTVHIAERLEDIL